MLPNNINQIIKAINGKKDIFFCYQSLFNPFIDFDDLSFEAYICKGVRFSYEYAYILKNFKDFKSDLIRKSISASLIMNNKLDMKYILNNIPINFWYPKSPSKETCKNLINLDRQLNFSLIVLSFINNWYDIIKICDFDQKDFLLECLEDYGTLYEEDLQKLNINFSFEFDPYVGFLDSSFELDIEDDNYILDSEERTYANYLYYVNNTSLEYIFYKNSFNFPFYNFNIEEIKYNFLLSNYILLNDDIFNSHLCSLALSNRIAFNIINHDLIKKYDVFYLFTYKIPSLNTLDNLYNDFPHLKYNIAIIYCFNLKIKSYYDKLNLDPDLDIYYLADFYKNEYIKNDMLNKFKLKNKWFRHMDFKKSKNITPIEVTFNDIIELGNILTTCRFT